MPAIQQRLLPETLRSRAASSFTGSYQTLGSVLSNMSRILKITNNTSVDVTISWDGTNDHEFLPIGTFVLLDETANAVPQSMLAAAKGTQFYVKAAAGTGTVYLSTYYAT